MFQSYCEGRMESIEYLGKSYKAGNTGALYSLVLADIQFLKDVDKAISHLEAYPAIILYDHTVRYVSIVPEDVAACNVRHFGSNFLTFTSY